MTIYSLMTYFYKKQNVMEQGEQDRKSNKNYYLQKIRTKTRQLSFEPDKTSSDK